MYAENGKSTHLLLVPELDDLANEIEKIEIKENHSKTILAKKKESHWTIFEQMIVLLSKKPTKVELLSLWQKLPLWNGDGTPSRLKHLLGSRSRKSGQTSDGNNKRVCRRVHTRNPNGKEHEYICDFIPTSSKFYCLPKIHKSEEIKRIMEERPTKCLKMSEPPSIPGRPIVGGPNCLTHKLSNLLDLILKPLAFQFKSYIKDSFHFLEMLPKSIGFDSTFVTFDVTSFYTNIPKELALSFWIDRFPESLTESRFTKEFVIAGFEIVLTFNYFMFDGKWYLQIKGVTMRTKAAVILAILTVGYLEIKLYTILPNYFSTVYTKYINEHWKRFIDDYFITSKKNENLDLFEEILNNLHPSRKFTKDTDDNRIPFLDLLVIKTAERKIETDISTKNKCTSISLFWMCTSKKDQKKHPIHTRTKDNKDSLKSRSPRTTL